MFGEEMDGWTDRVERFSENFASIFFFFSLSLSLSLKHYHTHLLAKESDLSSVARRHGISSFPLHLDTSNNKYIINEFI